MGKTRREKEIEAAKARKEQNRKSLIAAGVVVGTVALFVICVLALTAGKRESHKLNTALAEDGTLHVSRSSLKDGFNYVNWDGPQELILYTNAAGEVRAAFDSCEECHTRGNVHFTRYDDVVTCNVCGLEQSVDNFGEQVWGGCRPITVPTMARQDTDGEVVISADAMQYAVDMFALWDAGDLETMTFEKFANPEGEADAAEGEGETDGAADAAETETTPEPAAEAETTPEATEEPEDDAAE